MTNPDGVRLLTCPFCRSTNIDPEGWMSCEPDGSDKKTGPACDDCAGSTESVERWNTRAVSVRDAGSVRPSVNEYAAGYEYRGDQDYTPTEFEREIIEDAIEGYLATPPALPAGEEVRRAIEAGEYTDLPPLGDSRRALNSDLNRLREAMTKACDLLSEKLLGSPARSPGHNARLVLEAALSPSSNGGEEDLVQRTASDASSPRSHPGNGD